MQPGSLESTFPSYLPSPTGLADPFPLVEAWGSIREALVKVLEQIPDAIFAADSDRPGWSAGQNAEHLFKTQKAYSRLVPAVLSGRIGVDANGLLSLDYAEVFRTASEPGRFKNPESVAPEGTWEKPESLRRLAGSREAMEAALKGKAMDELKSRGFAHPLYGPISLIDWCFVLSAHEIGHGKSLVRKYSL